MEPFIASARIEYGKGTLRRSDLNDDPVQQFHKWLEEGSPTVAEPNAMAIATANGAGQPSIRMVLLKSYDDRGFVFGTNFESRKGLEIEQNPFAAALFYWPQLERQVRIGGQIAKVSDEESDAIFMHRPVGSRLAARISHQSAPVKGREELEQQLRAEQQRLTDDQVVRQPNWGGYRLSPQEFEFWQGGANRLHDRFQYLREDAAWKIQRLAP